MFERFTADARMAVVEAQIVARESGSVEIGPAHLLAGLVKTGIPLLIDLGVSADDIAAELARTRRRGGVSDADAEALTEFGIDVEQIVERVEQTHGEGALAGRLGPAKRGHIPFTAQSKKTLELSLKEAVRLGDKHLGQEHILLALAQQRGPDDVLARHGADYLTLRRAVQQRKAG
ncbi:Clp protease N-terminal domain-containing protein [Amycolatopsis tolypomycina]|uniref:Clp amino terminal domain-containing protein, pathogenicity island component n=1 Tax=Amycolatopsis tolypomycina TaxID=208445 RepID=A0A1H4I4A9_9PSEU|nr:Clp protease N-terminal domain-containing protein [Amycolatopsis tolypomycina]SEB28924.1 Clp amino terminal domain-containing protein, pathogenicity island component [Amycolatopsis tolypomycina]